MGVVETNTARVLARAVAGHRLTPRQAQGQADALVPSGRGWAWNSALLDLGATRCTSRAPACNACPLASTCQWAAAGWSDPDPASGSAGTGRPQSTFAGSDRQGRGRLVAALRAGSIPVADAAAAAGWPADGERVARVVGDGLVVVRDGWLSLP